MVFRNLFRDIFPKITQKSWNCADSVVLKWQPIKRLSVSHVTSFREYSRKIFVISSLIIQVFREIFCYNLWPQWLTWHNGKLLRVMVALVYLSLRYNHHRLKVNDLTDSITAIDSDTIGYPLRPCDDVTNASIILTQGIRHNSQCLKIAQNVSFQFLNFGIFYQFLSHYNWPVW